MKVTYIRRRLGAAGGSYRSSCTAARANLCSSSRIPHEGEIIDGMGRGIRSIDIIAQASPGEVSVIDVDFFTGVQDILGCRELPPYDVEADFS